MQVHRLVLQRPPQAFDEECCRGTGPRPSIENATAAPSTRSAKASLVNCAPWSAFSYLRSRPDERVVQSPVQDEASIVLDSRQERTCRVAQSITAAR